ncbi:uncharacterized protein LOC135130777 [Zophobas morio]|uniref:uncharacterized protein LOC135130777 n=1 Tax=Zophobas morio TaxID=2755281 RepID=UPI0030826CB5
MLILLAASFITNLIAYWIFMYPNLSIIVIIRFHHGSLVVLLEESSENGDYDYKSHKNQLNLQHFKTIRNELKHDIKIAYQLYTQNLEATIKTDPKKFWAHISRLKMRSGIPSEMIYLDNILRNPKDIVNAFMEHFHSSYSDFSPSSIDEFIDESSNNSINFISVTESNVFETLMTIKPNMTSGHDNIPGFLFHDCASVFSYPLSIIFNIILKTVSFPDVWKLSVISPIFKKGERHLIENYLPISLICNFSKIFEMILHKFLSFNVHNWLTESQHGFISGRPTVTNLSCFTQFVANSFDAKQQVDVIYTDFSRPFDKLNHRILLIK